MTFRTTGLLEEGGAWLTCKHKQTMNNIYCIYELANLPSRLTLPLHLDCLLCIQTVYSFSLNSASAFPKTCRRVSWFCCKYHSFHLFWFPLFRHYPIMLIADQPISVTDTMWQRHRAKYHWQWIQYEMNNIKNQDILYPGNHNRCSATDNAEEA